MIKRNNPCRAAICLLAGILVAGWAGTASADQRAGPDPMRKAQFMLRQMATEKAALAADKAKLEQDLKDLQKKYDRLEKKVEHAQKRLKRSEENGQRLVDRIGRDNDRIREYVGRLREEIQKYRNTVHDLRVAQLDNRLLVKAVKEREDWIATCRDKNRKLFKAGDDILEAYRNQGFWSSLTRASSPVGMGRVAKENQEQEFQFRLEDLQSGEFKPKTDVDVAAHTQPEPVPEAPPQEVPDPTGGGADKKAESQSGPVTEKPVKAEAKEKSATAAVAASAAAVGAVAQAQSVPVTDAAPPEAPRPTEKTAQDDASSVEGLTEGSLVNQKFMQEARPDVLAKVASQGCGKIDSLSPYVVEMPHGEVGARTWKEKWMVSGCGATYPVVIDFAEKGESDLKWTVE